MKKCHACVVFLLPALALTLAGRSCGRIKVPGPSVRRVVGPTASETFPGQWPWLAPYFVNENGESRFVCSSSLITRWHLLTAAHCIRHNVTDYFALLGRYSIADDSETNWIKRTMSSVFIHESYEPESLHFKSRGDIAIFRMKERVELSQFIQPVCLPRAKTSIDFAHGTVTGYGEEKSSPKQADLRTFGMVECVWKHEMYTEIVSETSFCAGNSMSEPCLASAGGGFFTLNADTRRFEVLGVVTHGVRGRCTADDFTVFSDVRRYIGWIYEKISECNARRREECLSPCDLNPCQPNAECESLSGSRFVCKCEFGFELNAKNECEQIVISTTTATTTTTPKPDACLASPCGPNARCASHEGFASCACLDGFVGHPPECRAPECFYDSDCEEHEACVFQKCTDLCMAQLCGPSSVCEMKNHQKMCKCLIGHRLNERNQCEVNPNLIDGFFTTSRCCAWTADDWPIQRSLKAFAVALNTEITSDDFEFALRYKSDEVEELDITNRCFEGWFDCQDPASVKFLPVRVADIFPNLSAFFANGYGIERVTRRNFENFHKLEFLSLFNNSILTIDGDSFEDLTEMKFISLGWNRLKTLSTTLFSKNLKLERVNLSRNRLVSITAHHFEHLTQLTHLDLCGNKLRTLDETLFASIRVTVHCWNQHETLPSDIFENLEDNRITELKEETNRKLRRVTMSDEIKE